MAGLDEIMAEGIHEMQQPRGTMGIPPCRGEGVEMGDFDWVY